MLLCCAWALAAQLDLPTDPSPSTGGIDEGAPAAAPSNAPELAVPTTTTRPLLPRLQGCLDQSGDDIDAARSCLRSIVDDAHVDGSDRRDAASAELVLGRLQRHVPEPAAARTPHPQSIDIRPVFVGGGPLEAGINGALFGGLVGFTGAAGVLSALRTSETEAFPWLLAAPALGVAIGAGGGVAAVEGLGADADDVAFVSSSAWAGTALGLTLQLAVFAESRDVQAAPLRFFTTLGGGLVGLGLGVGLSPFLDVEAGDAALANSGLLWGSALSALALASVQGVGLDFGATTLVVGAGGLLAWGGLVALHPFLRLHRLSTWLVDVGGVVGLLGGAVLGSIVGLVGGGSAFFATWTLGTAVGVGLGAVGAVVVDDTAHRAFDPPPPLAIAPAVFLTPRGQAPGVVLQVALW